MKTPANPFTIHIIAPQDVIPYVAPRRPSRVYRVRPSLAETLTRTGHGVVQTSRLAMFVVMQLFRMIVRAGVGSVHGIRFLYNLALAWMLFVFIRVPLFLLALCFLLFTIAFGWEILDALYRARFHLPRS
ncbi:MAG: hypothetical protein E8D41_03730 [Nitrospira sp.]|nr:MAG: hypothetical protein E8D41_03730 [Nitrospira sp.]